MHALECAGNLLRRPVPAQHGADQEPEVSIRMELGRWACMEAPLLASVLGAGTGIPLIAAVASQLTADGGLRPCRWAMACMLQPCWRSDASVTRSSACKCLYLDFICVHYPFWAVLHFGLETAPRKKFPIFLE